ncbi:MAG: hypothetical protein JOZ69_24470 [Myxococcales bacterium]|nr:hypothetical protein [Myxococcales bacterium]
MLSLIAVGCSASSPAADGGTPPDGGEAEAGRPKGTAGNADATAATDATGDAPAEAACPPGVDAGVNTYAPDDPNIQYSGRFDMTNPKTPRFAASSAYITAKFRGTAVSVMFLDENRSGSFNFFDVIVDDLPPVKITPVVGKRLYDATPPGLCDGVHTVTFVKRTEADTGMATFQGFAFTGTILAPDPKPARRIEIIGDSITCGAGVEAMGTAAPECNQNGLVNLGNPQPGYGQGVENGYLAYGSVLARTLRAEWHVTCASGIGLVRNYYSRGDQRPMPQIYPLLFPENLTSTTTWDTSLFVPDVIVIGLGTNDFSRDDAPVNGAASYRAPMDRATLVRQGYVPFIDRLAAAYPGVSVVLVSSPILGDMYPTPTDLQLSEHRAAIQDVVAYYAGDAGLPPLPEAGAAADTGGPGEGGAPTDASATVGAEAGVPADAGTPNVHVYAAVVDKVSGTGCGGHPSVQQQAAAAAQIATVIQAAVHW